MKRRDATAQTGYVKWPIHLKNTNEGGMFVYAVIPYVEDFEMCAGVPSVCLLMSESLVEEDPEAGDLSEVGWPLQNEWFPRAEMDGCGCDQFLSVPLLAAVCLGSSGGSFFDDEHNQHWFCKMGDLTWEGINLVTRLENLYGTSAKLLTWLDT